MVGFFSSRYDGTSSVGTLISDFWPPEVRDSKFVFLLFKPLSMWDFVIAALSSTQR
jgi:hypothetical protein